MIQRIALFGAGVVSVGLLVALMVVSNAKDDRIRELSGRIDDLSEGNRRARAELDAGVRRVTTIEAQTVSKGEFDEVVARYEAVLTEHRANLEARERQNSEMTRDVGRQREEVAALRSRLGKLEGQLTLKDRMLATMEKDRLDVIRQIVELEEFLAEREKQLAGLEDRSTRQDELLEELKRRDAEQSARIQKILDRLQNQN